VNLGKVRNYSQRNTSKKNNASPKTGAKVGHDTDQGARKSKKDHSDLTLGNELKGEGKTGGGKVPEAKAKGHTPQFKKKVPNAFPGNTKYWEKLLWKEEGFGV